MGKERQGESVFLSLFFFFTLYAMLDENWRTSRTAADCPLSLFRTLLHLLSLWLGEKKRVEETMQFFSYSMIVFFLLRFFLTTLKIWWPLYDVIVILAMVVDIAPQQQLTEVFTTTRNHHRSSSSSSSTHRRSSTTTNNTSSLASNTNNTMTNGHRFLVRIYFHYSSLWSFFLFIRLMSLAKRLNKFLDMQQLF